MALPWLPSLGLLQVDPQRPAIQQCRDPAERGFLWSYWSVKIPGSLIGLPGSMSTPGPIRVAQEDEPQHLLPSGVSPSDSQNERRETYIHEAKSGCWNPWKGERMSAGKRQNERNLMHSSPEKCPYHSSSQGS